MRSTLRILKCPNKIFNTLALKLKCMGDFNTSLQRPDACLALALDCPDSDCTHATERQLVPAGPIQRAPARGCSAVQGVVDVQQRVTNGALG